MKRTLIAAALAAAAMMAPTAMAQDAGAGGGDGQRQRDGGGGGGGGRGNWDPAQMRQMMMDRLKEQLKPSDEEWQVLQPKVEKLMTAQRNARATGGWGGGRGGWGGGGGGGGGGRDRGSDQPETEVGRASRELRTAVEDTNASESAINEKLAALRAAREKAEGELKMAREDLRELITPRQEAVLVMFGMLE